MRYINIYILSPQDILHEPIRIGHQEDRHEAHGEESPGQRQSHDLIPIAHGVRTLQAKARYERSSETTFHIAPEWSRAQLGVSVAIHSTYQLCMF